MIETAPISVIRASEPRSASHAPPRSWPTPPPRLVLGAAAVLLLLLGVLAAWISGIRLFVVESPSMGAAAPVGSLVVGSAQAPARVGDLITFSPPDPGGTTYTHRVVGRTADGFRTQGDINGIADPWTVHPGMIVSRATAVLPGVGWLVKGAPVLLAALVLAQVAGLFVRAPAMRWSIRTAALAVGVACISWTMRPFSGFRLLSSTASADGMHASVVSTGMLPIRVSAAGGGHVDLLSGQVGRLLLPRDAGGHVTMASQLDLGPLGWATVALVCLLPVAAVLVVGVPVEEVGDAAS